MTWRAWQTTATLLLFATSGLFGCASTQVDSEHGGVGQFVGELWPNWAGGEASNTPAPPPPTHYPNVYDVPPPRPVQILSSEQQTKVVADLGASRGRVSDKVKAANAFDEKLSAKARPSAARGQVIAGVAAAPN